MNCNTIYVSNVETTQTTIVLIPNREIRTLENVGCYRLVICCNATAENNLPVYVRVGTTDIPILCHAGNVVYANQLQKRRCYAIIYGDENPAYTNGQFVIQGNICPRATIIPATTKSK